MDTQQQATTSGSRPDYIKAFVYVAITQFIFSYLPFIIYSFRKTGLGSFVPDVGPVIERTISIVIIGIALVALGGAIRRRAWLIPVLIVFPLIIIITNLSYYLDIDGIAKLVETSTLISQIILPLTASFVLYKNKNTLTGNMYHWPIMAISIIAIAVVFFGFRALY